MKHTFIYCAMIALMTHSCKTETSKNQIEQEFDFAGKQLTLALHETDSIISNAELSDNPAVSPRSVKKNGDLILVRSADWTSGFFPGNLWYMYQYTQDKKWADAARKHTDFLEKEKDNGRTHDMGFKVFCSFGNGFKLTGDSIYRSTLIEAANTLATRYQPNAKIIRSWDHSSDKWACPVIIDNMMNLELLFWAAKETNDSTLYNIAVNHAQTTMKNHFREDYSQYHVLDYDTITGDVVAKQTHQGYAHESAWARGQAWAIYGYTMCYRETQLPEFLEQAKNVTKFFFENKNLPEDLIPYWDFDAPDIPDAPRDVSAATTTASALYELRKYDPKNAEQYLTWANTIMDNLAKHYKATEGGSKGFILLHSTGNKPSGGEIDAPIVYADYYYLEALLRRQESEKNK